MRPALREMLVDVAWLIATLVVILLVEALR